MDLKTYFEPIDTALLDHTPNPFRPMMGDNIRAHTTETGFPNLEGVDLVLLGVKEDRASVENPGCGVAPDYIRHYLYRLAKPHRDFVMADLGNMAPASTVSDTIVLQRWKA